MVFHPTLQTCFAAFLCLLTITGSPVSARAGHCSGDGCPIGVPAQHKVDQQPDRVAIKGYDPVAYFTVRAPMKGAPEFEYIWDDARWQFASATHRDLFAADPSRYAPQYGGYCATALALNYIADPDPEVWTIRDGKLYLNHTRKGQDVWRADPASHIAKAALNWERLQPRN